MRDIQDSVARKKKTAKRIREPLQQITSPREQNVIQIGAMTFGFPGSKSP